MSLPIHTIHRTTFPTTLPPYSSNFSHYSPHTPVVIENCSIDKIPPGLARAAWRTTLVSLPHSSSNNSNTRRLSSFSMSRTVPPPPPPRAIASSQTQPNPSSSSPSDSDSDSENPFNDSIITLMSRRPSPPQQRTHPTSQLYTVRLPSSNPSSSSSSSSSFNSNPIDALVRQQQRTTQRAAQDRETRCKIVAGILLNRVHAVGRPMRRVPQNQEGGLGLGLDTPSRPYKRSRLSTITTAEDYW